MALQALVYGWSATAVHALAGEPRTLRELDRVLDLASDEIVVKHVGAMEEVGLLTREPGVGEDRYAATSPLVELPGDLRGACRLEVEPDAKRIRTHGDRKLARLLVSGLHRALFGPGRTEPSRSTA